MVEERVGGGGDLDRGARELDRGGVLAAPRQRLGAHAAPGDRRLQVVAGERLALVAERFGLVDATLREQRAAEQRRGPRRVDAEPVVAQPVVRAAQAALRGGGVALEQLDAARRRRRPRAGAA